MTSPRFVVVVMSVLVIATIAPAAEARPLQYPAPVEEGLPTPQPPEVTAIAWILYDAAGNAVLGSMNPDERRSVASTTKIMTALVALEQGDLDDMVEVSRRATDTGEREIGLVAGEEFTLLALLKAMLIHSGNDAATAIAEHVGGSVEGFVELMNSRAEQMGLTNTRFANPHGLDAPDHHSSARDLLALARAAMNHPEFRDIVRSRMVVFPEAPDGSQRIGTATNLLLGSYEGAIGIKTGYTFQAMLTFVASAERDGRRLYAVVLGSDGEEAHLDDARRLLDHGFDDLGIYGTLITGQPHVARFHEPDPGSLVLASRMESLLHLAASGLLSGPPASPRVAPESVETVLPPVEVVRRHPDPAAVDLLEALDYWFDEVLGGWD